MKILLSILLAFLISIQILSAQETPVHEWVHGFGSFSGYDFPLGLTKDNGGNVVTTGRFHNTADFDPGTGVFNLTATGFDSVSPFILKLDNNGEFVWAGIFSGVNNTCQAGDVHTDAAGNIYVTGIFDGTIDFDPGIDVFELTSEGTFDNSFICKLDPAGNFLWAKRITGSFGQAIGSIVTDDAQNVYAMGHFSGTVDFDRDGSSFLISSLGQRDVFILKLNASGNFTWVKRFGGTDYEFGHAISLDASGNIYGSGVFQGTPDFDPGAGTVNVTSAGLRDSYIIKLDNDGNFIWVKTIGNAEDLLSLLIETDDVGNVYGTGDCEGTLDLDPGASAFNVTGTGFFVLKLDTDGEFEWGKFSNAGTNYSFSTDASGIYSIGRFQGTTDFDPGTEVFNLSSSTEARFMRKLDTDGNFIWAVKFENNNASGYVTTDDAGDILLTGQFITTNTDFDPDPCVTADLDAGIFYIHKLTLAAQPPPPCEEPEPEESLLVIYNAVSPNGNGMNEIFTIENIDTFEETRNNTVTIYNRWGDVVFDVSNYNNTDRVFTGISNGNKDLPSGIYYYKIEFTSGLKPRTGYLSLRR